MIRNEKRTGGVRRRVMTPEKLEARQLLAADPIHVGVVYLETDYLESDQDVGSDSRGDRFILSFTGGAPNTELTELRINTDKDGDGLSVGDPIYDTAPGNRGTQGSADFQVVRVQTADGRQIDAIAEVEDGGQELVLRLSNFRAGDRLEFTVDVDEILRNSLDLAIFNDRLDVITSGQEFQDSILEATFDAPHYETSHADAVFENHYGDPNGAVGLDLPPDEGSDVDSRPDRSAAAVATTTQVPKPISITGHVWIDNNLDLVRDLNEQLLSGIEIALWQWNESAARFDDTGHRAITDSDGRYEFPKSLALAPGQYQVIETQPSGVFSVGAVPGTVDGVATGVPAGLDALTNIIISLGDQTAINYDFAEAQPASVSGYVYRDDDNDGRRDTNEVGIAGVEIRLVPINTIAQQSELTARTATDGSYSFSGLAPGQYEIIEVQQPAGLADGLDAAGTIDGVVVGEAQNPGDRITQVVLAGDDDGIEYNFGELGLGSISGFVYLAAPGEDCTDQHDAAGNTPLPGVRVQLQTVDGITVSEVTTDANGSYTFEDIPHGEYRVVEFTPTGLLDGDSYVGNIDDQPSGEAVDGGLIRGVELTSSGVGTDYNFCEGAPASISGFVYQDDSNDGVRDPNERGIEGVRITLVDSDGTIVAITETDANGRYQIDDIPPGEYSIIETQPDNFFDGIDTPGKIGDRVVGRPGDDGDSIRQISIKQGEVGTEFNFGELLGASLSGGVHVDNDGDCVRDADEQGLAGVVIRLIDADGQQVAETTTDADGRYRFENIEPGTYTVIEEQPAGYFEGGATPGSAGGIAENGSRIGSINLASGEVAVDYDFCENPPAEIAGSVFNDADGDCFFDPGEDGIEGVRVELYDDSGNLIASTLTDAAGNYHFSNLPAGNYTLREIQPPGFLHGGQTAGSHGGNDSQADLISAVPVGFGDRLTQYNFCEVEPSSISGFVYVDADGDCERDDDEAPLEGVAIELRDATGTRVASTTTDANGQYQFEGLAPGEYSVFEVQPDGYYHGGQTLGSGGGEVLGDDLLGLTLSAGSQLIDYNFCELPPSSLSGSVWQETDLDQVFSPGDSPIPGVLVELIDDGGDTIATTQTDSAGDYRFDNLAPGVYSIRESQPANLFHGGQVVGSEGGEVETDDLIVGIVLKGGVDGTDYDFPEVPPARISGYVFQDGAALVLSNTPPPEDLRDYRDGVLSNDDAPISNVTLQLRNVLGQPYVGTDALDGVYDNGPIEVTTDENGYYEFVGLRPGGYHVYQVQPEDFTDSLDTAGTNGGVAVNPADQLEDADQIVVQTLSASDATNPHDDAILNVFLSAGDHARENNFSEIRVQDPVSDFLQNLPERETIVRTPVETFDPRIRVVAFAEPAKITPPLVAADDWGVTWHLSVINGGFPRGELATHSAFDGASAQRMRRNWEAGEHVTGRWSLMTTDGERLEESDGMTLGEEGAIALTGDFDGDGIDEAAIYVAGQWFVDLNGNGVWDEGDLWIQLGTLLDRPVVGDWDGDGKDDIGIFGRQWQRDPQRIKRDPGLPDPDNKRRRTVDQAELAKRGEDRGEDRERLLRLGNRGNLRADAVDHVFKYGEQVDTPIAGDWNGDGIDQIAVFRGGVWLLDSDGDGRWTRRDEMAEFGRPGDEPVVGDFDGDEIDEIAVVRGDVWIIDTDGDRRITGNDLQIEIPRESDRSQPIAGDWDGDGKDEPGFYDEAA